MSNIEIVLVVIFLIISYLIYRAIKKVADSYSNLGEQVRGSLINIIYAINRLRSNPEDLDFYLKFPASIDELNSKNETVVKLYANYLSQVPMENLPIADATIRANFEIDKFGIKEVLNEIGWKYAFKKEDSERKFTSSEFFREEIDNFWTVGWGDKKYISPLDLFCPIYAFIKKGNYKEGEKVLLDKTVDLNYYSYIKNRAILHNLRKLGIIKFFGDENKDNLFDSPFKFMSDDLDVIKKNINSWYSGHGYEGGLLKDNEEFDDWLAEHQQSEKLFTKQN